MWLFISHVIQFNVTNYNRSESIQPLQQRCYLQSVSEVERASKKAKAFESVDKVTDLNNFRLPVGYTLIDRTLHSWTGWIENLLDESPNLTTAMRPQGHNFSTSDTKCCRFSFQISKYVSGVEIRDKICLSVAALIAYHYYIFFAMALEDPRTSCV